MFDWMTWSIEIIGLVILSIWVIFPIQEFRTIAKHLRQERHSKHHGGGKA